MIVVDASIMGSFLLPDEEHPLATQLVTTLKRQEDTAIVPALFYAEIANILLISFRRQRISRLYLESVRELLKDLPLKVDMALTKPAQLQSILTLAEAHHLSVYDAAYLDLAIRKDAMLATLDKQLAKAADAMGVIYAAYTKTTK